jgi:transposase-like protein
MGKLRSIDGLFSGRHFDREVIILCVRWYLRFKLSFRDRFCQRSRRRVGSTAGRV